MLCGRMLPTLFIVMLVSTCQCQDALNDLNAAVLPAGTSTVPVGGDEAAAGARPPVADVQQAYPGPQAAATEYKLPAVADNTNHNANMAPGAATLDETQAVAGLEPVADTEPKLPSEYPQQPGFEKALESPFQSNVDMGTSDVSDNLVNPPMSDVMMPAETDLLKPNDLLARPAADEISTADIADVPDVDKSSYNNQDMGSRVGEPTYEDTVEADVAAAEKYVKDLLNGNTDNAAVPDEPTISPVSAVSSDHVVEHLAPPHELMIPAETELLKPDNMLAIPAGDAFNKELPDTSSVLNNNDNIGTNVPVTDGSDVGTGIESISQDNVVIPPVLVEPIVPALIETNSETAPAQTDLLKSNTDVSADVNAISNDNLLNVDPQIEQIAPAQEKDSGIYPVETNPLKPNTDVGSNMNEVSNYNDFDTNAQVDTNSETAPAVTNLLNPNTDADMSGILNGNVVDTPTQIDPIVPDFVEPNNGLASVYTDPVKLYDDGRAYDTNAQINPFLPTEEQANYPVNSAETDISKLNSMVVRPAEETFNNMAALDTPSTVEDNMNGNNMLDIPSEDQPRGHYDDGIEGLTEVSLESDADKNYIGAEDPGVTDENVHDQDLKQGDDDYNSNDLDDENETADEYDYGDLADEDEDGLTEGSVENDADENYINEKILEKTDFMDGNRNYQELKQGDNDYGSNNVDDTADAFDKYDDKNEDKSALGDNADYDDFEEEYDDEEEEYDDDEEEYDDDDGFFNEVEDEENFEGDSDEDDYDDDDAEGIDYTDSQKASSDKDFEDFWKDLGEDDLSNDEVGHATDIMPPEADILDGEDSYEDADGTDGAGKDMLESAHMFDSNIGVLGGAKVYNHETSTNRPMHHIELTEEEKDESVMSYYSWILLLSVIAVVFICVVFLHKHRVERILHIVGLRRRNNSGSYHGNMGNHGSDSIHGKLYRPHMSDEHKVLLDNEYA